MVVAVFPSYVSQSAAMRMAAEELAHSHNLAFHRAHKGDMVGDDLIKGRQCSIGRRRVHTSSSWNVPISLALFLQKSTWFSASAFQASAIISTVGYADGVPISVGRVAVASSKPKGNATPSATIRQKRRRNVTIRIAHQPHASPTRLKICRLAVAFRSAAHRCSPSQSRGNLERVFRGHS